MNARKPSGDQPLRADAADQRADPRRTERDQQAGGQERQRHVQRRPAEPGLQVQRGHELEADVAAEDGHRRDVGSHEPGRAQDAEPHERVLGAPLDRTNAASSTAARTNEPSVRRRAPADVRRTRPRRAPGEHARGDGERAQRSRTCVRATRGRVARQQPLGRDQRWRSRTAPAQEGPAPAHAGEQPAEDQPEREAARAEGRVDAERAVAGGPSAKRRRDDRQAGRRRERGACALHEARGHEQFASLVTRPPSSEREHRHGQGGTRAGARAGPPRGRRAAAARRSRARSR